MVEFETPPVLSSARGPRGPRGPRGRRGFAPVVLLFVNGIIAILIGFLVPAVERAGDLGRQAQGIEGLHDLGVAFSAAADDTAALGEITIKKLTDVVTPSPPSLTESSPVTIGGGGGLDLPALVAAYADAENTWTGLVGKVDGSLAAYAAGGEHGNEVHLLIQMRKAGRDMIVAMQLVRLRLEFLAGH